MITYLVRISYKYLLGEKKTRSCTVCRKKQIHPRRGFLAQSDVATGCGDRIQPMAVQGHAPPPVLPRGAWRRCPRHAGTCLTGSRVDILISNVATSASLGVFFFFFRACAWKSNPVVLVVSVIIRTGPDFTRTAMQNFVEHVANTATKPTNSKFIASITWSTV